jgi:ADP-heptose:LPS heptosyltransferase
MNYFVTHCDINFLKYAERLFETLSLFSKNKIIFYTVDFNYKSRFDNVIPIEIKSKKYLENIINYSKKSSKEDSVKAYNVFLKPFIIKELLSTRSNDKDNFCYLDADCLAIRDCDKIFDKNVDIIDYPLFNKGCHEFMMIDGRGDPFINNGYDLNYCLEADLMKLLNIDINLRKQYLQTGVFLFNKNCKDFIDEWSLTCSKKEIVENWKQIAPFHEETVVNCLLWKKSIISDLSQSLINLPYNTYDHQKSFNKIKEMLTCLEDVKEQDYFIDTFCRIPSKINLKNLCFHHGKISDTEYDYIKTPTSEKYLLKINSTSLGDTLAATPTLRKLYNSYDKKIDVITHHPDLFKNNKYVNKTFSFSENINENSYKEIFNTFLGVGGKKNEYGVEKKHNTIDIRQFHAIDLGFMLNEKEMEYNYIPDTYVEINDLPQNYICLHVANTWPSRTYSDKNWQDLINLINEKNIAIVLIGKNSHESGFYNIDKPTKNLSFKKGLDLTNKLNISQCWHVINKADHFITMDSGLLHLAGTTDVNIIQLGSSINYKLRAPYRNNSQDYKYNYIGGSCDLFCASNIKYGVKEWKTIQGVPPLINCLENKSNFDCHPKPNHVSEMIDKLKNNNYLSHSLYNYIINNKII